LAGNDIKQEARVPRISVGKAALEGRPHILYRFYDRTNVLLYIGITVNLEERMAKHAAEKDWWPRVDRSATRIEYYDSRRAALDAEREAIKAEKPLYNDQHNEWVEIEHHSAPLPRRALAEDILLQARSILGDDIRVDEAHRFASDQLRLPPDERSHGDENDPLVLATLALAETLASDTWRFRYVAQMLIEAVPAEMRWRAEAEAHSDYAKAGDEDAPWEERVAHVLRHLSYEIANSYDRSRPRFRGLRGVA
jgi:predicted GIY-YIG superfamily endonuclease